MKTPAPRRRLAAVLSATAAALAALGVTLLLTIGGHGASIQIRFGQPLTPAGQTAYKQVESSPKHETALGGGETPPPGIVAANQRAAEQQTTGPAHPVPLAAAEPVDETLLLQRNYSSRNGGRPALLVVHDTESPNVSGLQDVLAIRAWFNNPAARASSNYTTDADGNTVRLVPETAKAWTQAWFNPWAISDELIGHASQTTWPNAQLRAAARIFAAAASRWGIPVRRGAVRGCTIVRSGILEHRDLGACGGGHHDNGASFPLPRFIQLVREYQQGGYHPKPTPKPNRLP